jgi:DNA-binding response OmpR family regulator
MPEPTTAVAKVLVVEDEEIVSLFIRHELEDAGFAVEVATTVREARAKLSEGMSPFGAAVIDLRLPDEPGHLLVHELRVLHPALPIVVETGLTRDEMSDSLVEGPTLRALRKPFDGHQLVGALVAVGVHPARKM